MRGNTLSRTLGSARSGLRRIAFFYALAFAFSWGIWLILILNPAITP